MGVFNKESAEALDEPIWPPINGLVWVRLPCCESAIHPSRVEDYDGDDLVIAHPSKPHPDPVFPPSPSRVFVLGWTEGTGSTQVRVTLHHATPGGVPTWTVHAEGPPEVVQRRRFVRVEWDNEISLYLPMETVTGTIVDFSEGGVRCTIPKANEPRSPFIEVSFMFDDEPLLLNAEIVWWSDPIDDKCTVGLQLLHLAPALADRLRQFAYVQQIRNHKKGSGDDEEGIEAGDEIV